jgi:uncharacterized protein YutE (UPF0331/DUF86 family)
MKAARRTGHPILDMVADHYRRQGYVVKLQPNGADLPSFIAPFRPDLVAIRGNDKRLVVVKRRPKMGPTPGSDSLLERLKSHPEWTLEYYYAEGHRDVWESIDETGALTAKDIARRMIEAKTLLSQGHREAAFVLIWSAIEAVMRNFVAKRNLEIRGGAEAISSALVADGYLDHSYHQVFQRMVPIRNALVHGFRCEDLDEKTVTTLIDLVPAVQRELGGKARAS